MHHHHHAVLVIAAVHATFVLHPHVIRAAITRLASLAGTLFGGRKPRVSVVTPTWQRARLLNTRCRPSVGAQTYAPLEHIVVSDGPDPAVEICLPAHATEINRGLSARRYGASLAQGDIIAYLDDDNSWRPDHLARLVRALNGADFAYSRAFCVGQQMSWTIGEDPPRKGQIERPRSGALTGLPRR